MHIWSGPSWHLSVAKMTVLGLVRPQAAVSLVRRALGQRLSRHPKQPRRGQEHQEWEEMEKSAVYPVQRLCSGAASIDRGVQVTPVLALERQEDAFEATRAPTALVDGEARAPYERFPKLLLGAPSFLESYFAKAAPGEMMKC